MNRKKVFVSGCYDMLHSGHIAFLNEAATYGDVYIGLGSDKTIRELKGRETINSEDERKYMLENLKSVTKCVINKGSGILDFLRELDEIKPDIFIVNEDGNTPEKAELCKEKGIEYIVLKRIPYKNLPQRSTTSLRGVDNLPYRIDLAGTWIDQPYVSKYYPGPAIVTSLEPIIEFNDRSGMATSTRKVAKEIWPTGIPPGEPEKLAKILFSYDNPPGTKEISGSQDALGLVLPGINMIYYEKEEYWPSRIESIHDEEIISWLEKHLYLITLWPRPENFDVLGNTNITTEGVKRLSEAGTHCWSALKKMNLELFAKHFKASFEAQINLFPRMLNDKILNVINEFSNIAMAWKLSGAGGGGYLVLVSEKNIVGAMKVKIRRKTF